MPSAQFRNIVSVDTSGAPLADITVLATDAGYRVLASDATTGTGHLFDDTLGAVQSVTGAAGAAHFHTVIHRQFVIDGTPTLITLTDRLSPMLMRSINEDGSLGPAIPIGGSAGAGFRDLVMVGEDTQIFVATQFGSGALTSFSIDAQGTLNALATLSPAAADSSALAVAQIGGHTVVLVASAEDDSVSSYLVAPGGDLTPAASRGAVDGLGINGPSAIDVVTLGGDSYAIVAATLTSSVSVLRLAGDGSMTLTDHINDTLNTRFDHLQTIDTLTAGGHVFVLVGGRDDGLTLFMLVPDGTLQHVATVAQDSLNGLADIADVALALDGQQLSLFAQGAGSEAFTVLSFDISGIGNVAQAGSGGTSLSGGGFDDILMDGDGQDTLSGGDGQDIFALVSDGQSDTITDFDPALDSLDLSRWGRVYSLDALEFTPLQNGVRISFGDEVLTVLSHDGRALTQTDFSAAMLFGVSRSAPDAHQGDNSGALDGVINGTSGHDTIEGTAGDDDIRAGEGDDVILASAGDDVIDGGDGTDELSFANADAQVTFSLASSASAVVAVENIGGSDFDDALTGDTADNQIIGWGGDDLLMGGAGDDVLAGGDGNDVMRGGLGGDTLAGGDGLDTADYTTAALGVRVDPRHLHLNLGEAEGDRYIAVENFIGGDFADNLRGTTGANVISGGDGDDWLFGRWGEDTLYGGDGDDVLMGGAAADAHFGGEGMDRADYRESAVGLRVDLMTPAISTGIAAGDSFDSIENLAGSYHNDNLRGDHGDNVITGRSGDDVVFGRNGDDTLVGGDGDDMVYGGLGADTFHFTAGSDQIMDFDAAQGDMLRLDATLLDGQALESFGDIVNGSATFDFGDGNVLELVGFDTLEVPYEIIN